MSVTPTGSPAWARTADHTIYGGNVNKRNFMSEGVLNAETDVGAEDITRMAEDLAAVVRTAPFAAIAYTADDTTPANPTVLSVRQMTGVQTSSYAGASPPTGFPAATRSGDGVTVFTWSATYQDAYGQTAYVNLKQGGGSVSAASTGRKVAVVLSDANADGYNEVATVSVYDASGTLDTDQSVSFWVG
jgi:hypothetical protein